MRFVRVSGIWMRHEVCGNLVVQSGIAGHRGRVIGEMPKEDKREANLLEERAQDAVRVYRVRSVNDFGFEWASAVCPVGVAGDNDACDFGGQRAGLLGWGGCAVGFVVWPIGHLAFVGLRR